MFKHYTNSYFLKSEIALCTDGTTTKLGRGWSLCFLGWGSDRDACYSLKCLESVPFPLQSVSVFFSFFLKYNGIVFVCGPTIKEWALRHGPPQPGPTGSGGCFLVVWGSLDTHVCYMWSFKDIAAGKGYVCRWGEIKSRLGGNWLLDDWKGSWVRS